MARRAQFLFRNLLNAVGCIARPHDGIVVRHSGDFNRPQFGQAKHAVKLMTLGVLHSASFVTNVEPSLVTSEAL